MTAAAERPRAGALAPVAHASPLRSGATSVVLLASMAGIGQFAAGVCTPAFPAMARSLEVDASAVQLTLAVFLAAFAAGQLIFGLLADRFGRRPVLFGGFVLFLAATLGCAVAPDLGALLFARTIQGLGAASPVVIARAAARDSFDGIHLVRLTAMVMATFALVPGFAPLIGAATLEAGGWRAGFWLTLGAGAGVLVLLFLKLPETGRSRLAALDVRAVSSVFASIVEDRAAMYGIVSGAMTFGTLAAFNAASPTLYIEHLGVSPSEFGLYTFLSVAAIIVGSLLSRRMATNRPPSEIIGRGLALMVFGLVLMLAFPLVGFVHKHLFNVTLMLYSAGLGLVFPTVNSMVLLRFSENVGFVSAMLGFLMFSGAALGAAAASVAQTVLPVTALPLVMLVMALGTAAATPALLAGSEGWRPSAG